MTAMTWVRSPPAVSGLEVRLSLGCRGLEREMVARLPFDGAQAWELLHRDPKPPSVEHLGHDRDIGEGQAVAYGVAPPCGVDQTFKTHKMAINPALGPIKVRRAVRPEVSRQLAHDFQVLDRMNRRVHHLC